MIPMLSFNISICSTICEDVSNSSTSPSSHALISASLSARSLVFWWQLQYSFCSRTTLIPFCTSIVLPFQVLYCVSHLAFFSFCNFCRCCNICCVFWKTNHYRTSPFVHSFIYVCDLRKQSNFYFGFLMTSSCQVFTKKQQLCFVSSFFLFLEQLVMMENIEKQVKDWLDPSNYMFSKISCFQSYLGQ